jgi:hypothetical protein
MKLVKIITSALLFCFLSFTGVVQAQIALHSKPYRLMVNQLCEDFKCKQFVIEVLKGDEPVLTEKVVKHGEVFITVVPEGAQNVQTRLPQDRIPQDSFYITVVNATDTSRHRVLYTEDSISVKTTRVGETIDLEPTWNLPKGAMVIQFKGHDGDLLTKFRARTRDIVRIIFVREGYYRCIPAKVIKKPVGRWKSNQNSLGTICFLWRIQGFNLVKYAEVIKEFEPYIIKEYSRLR